MTAPRSRVEVVVNGARRQMEVEPRWLLADCLREQLGLTGTHLGCEHGVCGACTILLNDKLVRSCLILAVQADGARIMTVEGLATDGRLHPIQQAFWDHHALQCGFCTPGILMTAYSLLRARPNATADEVREALGGNLCRCTGYQNITKAILAAGQQMRDLGRR